MSKFLRKFLCGFGFHSDCKDVTVEHSSKQNTYIRIVYCSDCYKPVLLWEDKLK